MKVGIYYFRTLFSQSAASLSVGKFSKRLSDKGYYTKITLLKIEDYIENEKSLNNIFEYDIVVYKVNYKDFEYGIRLFKELLALYPTKFYLAGPFAVLNKKRIANKYIFIDGIVNLDNSNEVDELFIPIGTPVFKPTIISHIDREIEFSENFSYINIESSIGCDNNCLFCHISLLGIENRKLDLEHLIEEIEYLVNKLNKKFLIFNDSIFCHGKGDEKRVIEFYQRIKAKNIKFYFYIYLGLSSKLSDLVLKSLVEIGLVRVFFGIENITQKFAKQNRKLVSKDLATNFIALLDKYRVNYHIGFILFTYDTEYCDILPNITFLFSIKKLFRIGVLLEKMRILPDAVNSQHLAELDIKIDQAYNYKILDSRVEQCYWLLQDLFKNINVRSFEHFFTSINIASVILIRENLYDEFIFEIENFAKMLEFVNRSLFDTIKDVIEKFVVTYNAVCMVKDLYAKSETNYYIFMTKLKDKYYEIYRMIPHGKESLNI